MAQKKKVRAGSDKKPAAVARLRANECWWQLEDAKEAAMALVCWADESIRANSYRASRAYRFASLFEGYTLTNLSSFGAQVDNDQIFDALDVPVIRFTCRRKVLTFINKALANDNPVPQFVCNGADYEQTLAAENMDDVIMTEFDQEQGGDFSDVHELWRHAATIATSATGRCYIFAFPGDENVEAELDDSLTVGVVRNGQYGPVNTMCRSLWRDPEATIERYPDHADAILNCIEERSAPIIAGSSTSGRAKGNKTESVRRREVRIIQGWRCKVGSTEGRRIYCLKDGTVLKEGPWKKKRPPCVWWDFEKELGGESGTPMTQTIYRQAVRQNEITNEMDHQQHNTPQVTYLVQRGTADEAEVKGQLEGATGVKIVTISGKIGDAVQVMASPGLAQSSLELEQIYDNGMAEDTGISKAHSSATGQPGTTSGIQESLRASYLTENFADQTRRLVRARGVDTARIFLWAMQEMLEDNPGKFERWVGKNRNKKVTAKDLDLDENKYVMSIKAVSDEKDSPRTRLQKAEQLLKDPSVQFTGADLVQTWKTLDVDKLTQQLFAIEEWVEEQHQRWLKSSPTEMARDTFYQSPAKWFRLEGLGTALRVTSAAYVWAKQDGAPPQRLKYFEKFMDECVHMIEAEEKRQATNAGTVKPPAPGGSPPAPTAPMPTGP